MNSKPLYAFPATLITGLRAEMGDRRYYVATMTFAQIATSVRKVKDIHEKKELKTWIQRDLRPERTQQIADYLTNQKNHFFNAIVLGIYDGDADWLEVDVTETIEIKELQLDKRRSTAFGVIYLSGKESIFAIDGQHRVEGIKAAVAKDPKLGSEEQAVIFISHKVTPEGRERTRRLFSTLNTYARPVPESELVALSEDDVFAKVTRQLIESYPGLSLEFVPMLPSANIPATEKTALTTVVGLYHLAQVMAPKDIRSAKTAHKIGPIDRKAFTAVHDSITQYWDAVKKHVPAVRAVCASDPKTNRAAKHRHEHGGNLLFRTVGMKAFARAVRTIADRGVSIDKAVAKLRKVSLELDSELWRDVLWQAETKTMIVKYSKLAQNIFLHEVGEAPNGKTVSVPAEYRRITGRRYPR